MRLDSIATPPFPFAALAKLAARAQDERGRDAALAAFMAARLGAGLLPAAPRAVAAARRERAAAARRWFAQLALPAAARVPLARLADASAGDDRAAAAELIDAVATSLAAHLDTPARAELARLREALVA